MLQNRQLQIGFVIAAVLTVIFLVSAESHAVRTSSGTKTQTIAPSFPTIDKARGTQIAKRDELLALLDPKDSSSLFTVLDTINKHPALFQNCHEIGHDLGHKAFELYGFSGAMALNTPNRQGYLLIGEICAGGYMHGVLEELLVNQPDLKSQIEKICLVVPIGNRASCYHGIGHGVMFVNERNIAQSIADCQTVGKVPDQTHCFEGVWMELFWGDTGHNYDTSLGWPADQPLLPCLNAPTIAKPACFLYANLGYLRLHPRDFPGAIAECSEADLSSSDRSFCLKGVGMTMMQSFLNHRLTDPDLFVKDLPTSERTAYYLGLLSYARLSDVKENTLQDFCGALHADAEICSTILRTTTR